MFVSMDIKRRICKNSGNRFENPKGTEIVYKSRAYS